MNKALQLLIEAMSPAQAYKVLDIDPSNEFDLKASRNAAALKHHPDRGGDAEMQKKVNAAYDILKRITGDGKTSGRMTMADWDAKREATNKIIKTKGDLVLGMVKQSVNTDKFLKYIEDKTKLKYKVEYSDKINVAGAGEVAIGLKFISEDGKTIISFQMFIPLSNVDFTSSLGGGSGTVSFKAFIDKFILHNNKKNKLGRTTWSWDKSSSDIEDPSKAFPPAKLKSIFFGKATKRKFSKRDMHQILRSELKATLTADWAMIPLDDKGLIILSMHRTTMMRQGVWHPVDVRVKEDVRQISGKKTGSAIFATLPETDKSIEWIRSLKKLVKGKNPDKMGDIIMKDYKKNKAELFTESFSFTPAQELILELRFHNDDLVDQVKKMKSEFIARLVGIDSKQGDKFKDGFTSFLKDHTQFQSMKKALLAYLPIFRAQMA